MSYDVAPFQMRHLNHSLQQMPAVSYKLYRCVQDIDDVTSSYVRQESLDTCEITVTVDSNFLRSVKKKGKELHFQSFLFMHKKFKYG